MSAVTSPATFERDGGLVDRMSSTFWRQPRLLLFLMLTPPLLWLGIIYIGSLFALLAQSFFSLDDFTGQVKYELTLSTYAQLFRQSNLDIIIRTVVMAAMVTIASAIIAFPIAYYAARYAKGRWKALFYLGAMLPLSTAMVETGAAELLAEGLVGLVGDAGPLALLAGLFVLTAIMGQLISNTATALIMIPIGVAAAASMGISPRPVLMSIAVAAAAAFLTPIATPTNLMVMAPGGYAFTDYWKLGLPLLIWFFVVSVFLVPLIWSF